MLIQVLSDDYEFGPKIELVRVMGVFVIIVDQLYCFDVLFT